MARNLRVGQRIKLNVPHLNARGVNYGDVVEDLGNGYAIVMTIHRTEPQRERLRVGPEDYTTVPGKPPFPHIDGERDGFGARRGNKGEKGDATPYPEPHPMPNGGEGEGEGEEEPEDGDEEGDEGEAEDGNAPKDVHPLINELVRVVEAVVDEALKDVTAGTDEAKVREIAAEEAAKVKGGVVKVTVRDLPPVELAGKAHAALKRVLSLVSAGVAKRNVMLVGPAGCGKTTLAAQIAEVFGINPTTDRTFAALSCSMGMSETKILGRVIPRIAGDDASVYEDTNVVYAYENGGVILFDELDNSDPNVVTVLNTFLDNGYVTLPNGKRAVRHKDTVVLCSANTYGHGADRIYVGRNALDGATLDRFVGATLSLDYDRALETDLCPEEAIRKAVWAVRDKARAAKLRRVVSTRFLLSVRTLHLGVGDKLTDAIRACAEGWTEADLRTCGIIGG